ncbi:MAG TPA: putative capsular polysaccharide synthesis family protein [Pyrinomonadaceae bacterium]|nr:putative capsular polysaccharide synthesis family protein [Pyrinomonadaceae bacterium]
MLRRVLGRSIYQKAVTVFVGLRWRRRKRLEYPEAVRRSVESPSPPVLIYQMAKVGSSTVTWALKEFDGLNVFQVHLLNPDNIRRLRDRLRKRGLAARFRTDMDILGRALYDGLIRPGLKAKVITLVREPIGRNCSFYFQNLDVLWQTADAHEGVDVSRLAGEYLERFDHRGGLRWFDSEFKPVLGVDIYEHPFPHDKGHARITTDLYDILVLRTDLDDESKRKCVEEFLGVEGLSLRPRNVGSQKPYAATYRDFLDALRLPESYVDEMLDSKYTRHFFTPDERATLRAKWLGGSVRQSVESGLADGEARKVTDVDEVRSKFGLHS